MGEGEWMPEDEDRSHEIKFWGGVHPVCTKDMEPWPCTWEKRRRHVAEMQKVIDAAYLWAEVTGDDTEWDCDNHLFRTLAAFDEWKQQQTTEAS
jgi:hypothetical protein